MSNAFLKSMVVIGDEGWEIVGLHSFNDSSQRMDLHNSGVDLDPQGS